MLAWSRGVLGGHLDIAVVLEPGSCGLESGCDADDGAGATEGSAWSPFFLPMPHLCVFDTQQVIRCEPCFDLYMCMLFC